MLEGLYDRLSWAPVLGIQLLCIPMVVCGLQLCGYQGEETEEIVRVLCDHGDVWELCTQNDQEVFNLLQHRHCNKLSVKYRSSRAACVLTLKLALQRL